jgi:hypothetical protein
MTCIVGYESDGKVYIGGDSAGVRGLDVTVREDSKVFKKEGLGYGNDIWVHNFIQNGSIIKILTETAKTC